MCEGSHKAKIGKAIRITSRIRSVRMKGITPLKMVEKLTSLHHAFDDKHVHPDRRMDQPEFHRHHDDDAEPDRIEAEVGDDREDDRHRQDDHRHRVHQAAEHQVHQHDQRQHAVAAEAEAGEEFGDLLRRLRDGEEVAEQQRADQHGEHGRGRARRLQAASVRMSRLSSRPRSTPIRNAPAAPTPPASVGVNAAETAAIEPADHEDEQQQRRPDVLQRRQAARCQVLRSPAGRKPGRDPADDGDGGRCTCTIASSRQDAGDEQLADVLLGDDAVDREHGRRRQHGAERAAGGDHAGGEALRIAVAPHFRIGDGGERGRGRDRRAADRGKAAAGRDGGDAKPAAQMADEMCWRRGTARGSCRSWRRRRPSAGTSE